MSFIHGDQILILVSSLYIKTNANRGGSFKNKIALRKNAMSEKRRRLVKDNEVYVGSTQRLAEICHQAQAIGEYPRGRNSPEQNCDVDIAIRAVAPVGNRPANVRRLDFAPGRNALRNAPLIANGVPYMGASYQGEQRRVIEVSEILRVRLLLRDYENAEVAYFPFPGGRPVALRVSIRPKTCGANARGHHRDSRTGVGLCEGACRMSRGRVRRSLRAGNG